MHSKAIVAAVIGLGLGLQAPATANDFEKLFSKAKTSGTKSLLKEVGKITNSKQPDSPQTPAPASTAVSTTAAAAPTSAPAASATAAGAPPTATNPTSKSTLTDKATKEITRAANKYGSKYLKTGEKELTKLLK
jgi:hypothetical protein